MSPRTVPDNTAGASLRVPSEQPSRARHVVLWFVISLAIITYVDRVCISQTAGDIRRDLALDEKQMGWVFFAFGLAYALFEIPGGWMGDRYGPRSVLMKVVVLWSVFTAATGAAWNYASMLVSRFLFGVGEAGCFPNVTKIFTIWLPSNERVRAQGILWLSARWGGAFTPLLVLAVLAMVPNWRWAFYVFGAIGIVWAIAFYLWFRDNPKEHPSVNAAEYALMDGAVKNAPSHASVPWAKLCSNPTVLLLWLQYFCMSYGWYFYVTWLPTYLRQRGMDLRQTELMVWLEQSLSGVLAPETVLKIVLAALAGIPLFFGGVGCFAGGWLAKRLAARSSNVRRARRSVAFVGLFMAGAMLVVATKISNPALAMLALGLASFSNDLAMAPDWAACMDVGGRLAGSLSGSMNMMGNFGGMLGPLVVGYILNASKSTPDSLPTQAGWTTAFLVSAGVYFVGAIAWLFIDPVTPIEDDEKAPVPA